MKNIYLFIVFLIISGCNADLVNRMIAKPSECPDILYSSEHRTFFGFDSNNISLENISYKVDINNAEFIYGCKVKENLFLAELPILFIANSLDQKNELIKYGNY